MIDIAAMTERHRQVTRPNEQPVDACHARNLHRCGHRLRCFQLRDHAHFLIDALDIIGNGVVATGSMHARKAAITERRVATGARQFMGFIDGVDHRKTQRQRAHIQRKFDLRFVVRRHAHNGGRRRLCGSLQQRVQPVRLCGGMLNVEDQIVVADVGHQLRHYGRAGHEPAAGQLLPFKQRVFEWIV